MSRKKLLITGCGRSGTVYSAKVWRALGLDIAHERDNPQSPFQGDDGIASWFLAVDDPNPPFGPSAVGAEFEYIIHQVRHPLLTISSFAQFILQHGKESPEFIRKYISDLQLSEAVHSLDDKQQLILQAARYWYHWNHLAELKASESLKVEELENHLPRLCDLIGIPFKPELIQNISKETNSRSLYVAEKPWELNWSDIEILDPILHDKIRELAGKYGYKIE
jgi:hypothetical protein